MHVPGDDAQDIVLAAGDGGAVGHLRPAGDLLLEGLEVFPGRQAELDGGIDLEAQAQLLLVQQGDPALDHADILEALDPPPAGGRGKADPLGDFRHGQSRVILDQIQDSGVNGVEQFRQSHPRNAVPA